MSVRRLVQAAAWRWTRPYRLILMAVAAFLLAPLAYRLAHLHGNRRPHRSRFLHKGIMNRLELGLYHLIIAPLVAFLPARLAYGAACRRADWRYRWDMSAREEIIRNLEGVLGEQLSEAERERVARDFFRVRSCEAVDVMRLAGRGRALARLVEIRGLEHVEAALAGGKGAILASAHFGSYHACFSLIGMRGLPITIIGRWPSKEDLNRSPLERFFFRYFSQKPVERHLHRPTIQPRAGQLGVAVQAATVLRQNELLGTHLDPPVPAVDRGRTMPMEFLNGQAQLSPGAITIAQLMGAPLLMTFLRRSADWRHQVLEISAPMALDGDVKTAFGRCLAVVEAAIRQDPAHWLYWELSALVELGLLPEAAMQSFT